MASGPPSPLAAEPSSAARFREGYLRPTSPRAFPRRNLPLCSGHLLLLLVLLAAEATPRCHAAPESSPRLPPGEALDLREALGALGRALRFFEANHGDINLDGLLGTVVVQAQLHLLLVAMEEEEERRGVAGGSSDSGQDLNEVVVIVRLLYDRAQRIVRRGLPAVRRSSPYYYQKMGHLLTAQLWEVPLALESLANASQLLQKSPLPHDLALDVRERSAALLAHIEQLDQNKSDLCIAEALGDSGDGEDDPEEGAAEGDVGDDDTKRMVEVFYQDEDSTSEKTEEEEEEKRVEEEIEKEDEKEKEEEEEAVSEFSHLKRMMMRKTSCSVSLSCWKTMTEPGYTGYSLTHQVLYLILAMQKGCLPLLDDLAAAEGLVSSRRLLLSLCTNVLKEALLVEQARFPDHRRDLFMEQGAVCGLLGFREFFRLPWLTQILAWQKPSGCFGESSSRWTKEELPEEEEEEEEKEEEEPSGSRLKREERPLGRPGEGCLSHRTGVAVGYLALFVRALVQDLFFIPVEDKGSSRSAISFQPEVEVAWNDL
ncbi:uncharacterized protein LOC143027469 [Oratosquilla oratoria]|uniref:uncharacterized protein LOC143027469 n=1 Tax=Oratosquilla oratoria TaxID=337810 RepID=UPI003F76AF9B